MIPMKTLTIKGKTYEIVDEQARSSIVEQRESIRRTCSTAIVQTVEGSPIVVQDSSDNQLLGLKLFGKTTQNGTPSPESPQPLIGAAPNGTIDVYANSLNLIDASKLNKYANVDCEVTNDGYTISVTGGSANAYTSSTILLTSLVETLRGKTVYFAHDQMSFTVADAKCGPQLNIKRADRTEYLALNTATNKLEIQIPEDAIDMQIGIYTNNTDTKLAEDNTVFVEGLRLSLVDCEWTSGVDTTMQVYTVDEFHGIRAVSDGNYIDEDGQHYTCDEIDLERGIYIQRVRKLVLDGSEIWHHSVNDADVYLYHTMMSEADTVGYNQCYCDKLIYRPTLDIQEPGKTTELLGISPSTKYNVVYINVGVYMTENSAEALNAYLSENPVTVIYILKYPIEIELTEQAINDYKKLYSAYPGSIFMNSGNIPMEVKYNADTKLYIQNLIQEVIDHG